MGIGTHYGGMEQRHEDSVAALHKAILRSLSRASQSITEDDSIGRVTEIKKVTDLLTYLQATLRMKFGRSAAVSLSDFYAAMFTLTLEASQCESTEGLDEVIGYVSRVRDACVLTAGQLRPVRVASCSPYLTVMI